MDNEETKDIQVDDIETEETEVVSEGTTEETDETIEEMEDTSGRVSTKDEDSPDGVIGWIGKQFKKGKKVSPEDLQEEIDSKIDTKTDLGNERTGEIIPEVFTEAALKVGWDDKMIEDFVDKYDYSDDELIDMIPHLGVEKQEKETVSQEQAKESEQPDKSVALDKETDVNKLREQLKDELKKELEAEFGDLKESLNQAKKEREVQILVDMERQANGIFDDVSKDFEVFGKTDDLPKFPDGKLIPSSPAFQARSKVYDVAMGFLRIGFSKDIHSAMKEAISWYKGSNLEKDVERKYIKRLRAGEKRLSAKRTSKDIVKKYDNEDDENADEVRQVAKELGVDLD